MGAARAPARRAAIEMTRLTSEPNEKLPVDIAPDVILPVQFFTHLQCRTAWTGEQRLMAALLEDALKVCGQPARSATAPQSRLLCETMRWLRSNDRSWMFSFLRICETLDLDPGSVRRGVYRRRAEACPPSKHVGVASAGVAPSGLRRDRSRSNGDRREFTGRQY